MCFYFLGSDSRQMDVQDHIHGQIHDISVDTSIYLWIYQCICQLILVKVNRRGFCSFCFVSADCTAAHQGLNNGNRNNSDSIFLCKWTKLSCKFSRHIISCNRVGTIGNRELYSTFYFNIRKQY